MRKNVVDNACSILPKIVELYYNSFYQWRMSTAYPFTLDVTDVTSQMNWQQNSIAAVLLQFILNKKTQKFMIVIK